MPEHLSSEHLLEAVEMVSNGTYGGYQWDLIRDLGKEIQRLNGLINSPHTEDFLEAVRLEAAHQRERWGSEHDDGKADTDWFWLIGYLAGKAIHKPEKQLHHIITTAAACLNWHAARSGADTRMRPGIEEPQL